MRSGIPELASEPAQVVALAAVAMIEARHVHVRSADAVVIIDFATDQLGCEAANREADLLGEIAADDVGRIANAVRKPRTSGIEQNAAWNRRRKPRQ